MAEIDIHFIGSVFGDYRDVITDKPLVEVVFKKQ